MNRLAVGAALGGLAVYLYDPELGGRRRERLSSLWQENRESVFQAGRVASETIDSAKPQVRRITKAMSRADWAQALDRDRAVGALPKLIGAAAVGALLVYFIDSGRRRSALEAGRRAVRQAADTVKPLSSRVGDRVAEFVEDVRSNVS